MRSQNNWFVLVNLDMKDAAVSLVGKKVGDRYPSFAVAKEAAKHEKVRVAIHAVKTDDDDFVMKDYGIVTEESPLAAA